MSILQPLQTRTPNKNQSLRQQLMIIETTPRRTLESLVKSWEQAFDLMWSTSNDVTPEERMEALGQETVEELFDESRALVTYIVSRLKGKDDELAKKLMAKAGTVPPFSFDENGKVIFKPAK